VDEAIREGIISDSDEPIPACYDSIKDPKVKTAILKKIQGDTDEDLLDVVTKKVDRHFASHKANCRVKWGHFADLFHHQCEDDSGQEAAEGPRKQKKCKTSKYDSLTFFEGILSSQAFKTVIKNELATNKELQNCLKPAVRQMMPSPREAAVALTANGITKSQYQGFCRANDSMAGCFIPMPKISRVRVEEKHAMCERFKLFCLPDGTHCLGLLQLVEEWIDIFKLHGKHRLVITINYDCATMTFSAGNPQKATEVTISIFPYGIDCSKKEWKFWQKLVRSSSCLMTMSYIPYGDSPEVFQRTVRAAYDQVIDLLKEKGIHVYNNQAVGGLQKTLAGGKPDKIIQVEFVKRSDLQGQWNMYGIGGMSDKEGKFCLHCNELLNDHKAGKYFEIETIVCDETLSQVCERLVMSTEGIKKLNRMLKSPDAFQRMFDTSEGEFQESLAEENQTRLQNYLQDPELIMEIGTKIPVIRFIEMDRCSGEAACCSFHAFIRTTNMIIGCLQEKAAQMRKVATVNLRLQE